MRKWRYVTGLNDKEEVSMGRNTGGCRSCWRNSKAPSLGSRTCTRTCSTHGEDYHKHTIHFFRSGIALSFYNMSLLLRDSGRKADVLKGIEEAVGLCRTLAASTHPLVEQIPHARGEFRLILTVLVCTQINRYCCLERASKYI